ncbi:MAG: hypothetical protein JNM39_05565 [Bdellovibrionaceae bacterium]|nr:hypothetical protein [Pseudobdellovibrionaceae bacterium]
MKNFIFSLLAVLFVFGCSKPEPNPELRDPIYQDFLAQKAATEKDLADTIAKMTEYSAAAKKAPPQTGQFKQNQRKFDEMDRRATKLKQQLQFWEIRIEERVIASRLSYNHAYAQKTPWPNQTEADSYKAEKKLRLARTQWDQKERIRILKMGSSLKNMASEITKGQE